MRGRKDESNLPLYESQPPKWLPKSHATADLGTISPFSSTLLLLRYALVNKFPRLPRILPDKARQG